MGSDIDISRLRHRPGCLRHGVVSALEDSLAFCIHRFIGQKMRTPGCACFGRNAKLLLVSTPQGGGEKRDDRRSAFKLN
jgi:hypothetical protein